jgi:AcrR family transcriptional regulator
MSTRNPAPSRKEDRPPAARERRSPARDRLLAAADELFYEEGVHTVGIDRVIEKAGVAKATLYSAFGSKDELVRAYLNARHAARQERMTRRLAAYDDPRERLLGVFDLLAESIAAPGFNGCAFVNASAESPAGSAAEEATTEYRTWMRNLFADLARDAGASDPAGLARQFQLLHDGVNISARMDRDPSAATAARAAAVTLLDAATAR